MSRKLDRPQRLECLWPITSVFLAGNGEAMDVHSSPSGAKKRHTRRRGAKPLFSLTLR
jgi:hypothetical protein